MFYKHHSSYMYLLFLLLIFLNGIVQFKHQFRYLVFRNDFLSVNSDCRVQCPRMGLEV